MLHKNVYHRMPRKCALSIIMLSAFLSACTSTHQSAVVSDLNQPEKQVQRMNASCIEQVNAQQQQLETANEAQYLSLANTALHCIDNIAFSPSHPDSRLAMQFNALAFNNFVKAGDMQEAQLSLSSFRKRFPQQDLMFADYTSFVDTATVLVNHSSLSRHQLTVLNINEQLRDEIIRQRHWSMQ